MQIGFTPHCLLNSINTLLQNTTPKINSPSAYYHSGYIDLFPIRNLYITSNLGNHSSLSINGEWDIMRKVPVRAGYNEMIYDNGSGLTCDYLDCSNQTLSRIHFKMKDSYNNIINLHGNHWSFSIVFIKVNEE